MTPKGAIEETFRKSKNHRILIIDDEEAMGRILTRSLELDDFEAVSYTNPIEALDAVQDYQPDVILTDFRMPEMNGREVLVQIKKTRPDIPVLIMTAHGKIEDAVTLLQEGAFNYLTKPFQHEDLVHQIRRAIEHRHLEEEIESLSHSSVHELEARKIVGSSQGLKKVINGIERSALSESAVLITGESGVGKELVAREIHRLSARHHKRFVAVNCPAIPSSLVESELFGYEKGSFSGANESRMGMIELSTGGTLFLDEIGELPLEIQSKLLRVLQEHEIQRIGGRRQIPVDLRVIAATNRDLHEEVESGNFRLDLYYRLNVLHIQVPSLSDRPDDIPELANHFLDRILRRNNRSGVKISSAVMNFLKTCPWPGNIRQLENTLERMVSFSTDPVLDFDSLPPDMQPGNIRNMNSGSEDPSVQSQKEMWPENYKEAQEKFEREYLEEILRSVDGNVTLAARVSGISRRSLYEKFNKLGIKKTDYKK